MNQLLEYLQKPETGLEDNVYANKLISFQNEVSTTKSDLGLVLSDDTKSDQETIQASVKAMLLARDHLTDLQLSGVMPSHLTGILESAVNALANVEQDGHTLEMLISKHGPGVTSDGIGKASARRSLSSIHGSAKYHFNPGVTKADYHHRAKSRPPGQGMHNLGNLLGNGHHQQGFRNARASREEGKTTHRRLTDDTNVCLPASQLDRKIEQCFRLANCAKNYGLYDMFAYYFADDLDFDTGVADDKIQVRDERDLREKVRVTVKLLSFHKI